MRFRDRLRRLLRDRNGALAPDVIVLTIGLILVGIALLVLFREPVRSSAAQGIALSAGAGMAAQE